MADAVPSYAFQVDGVTYYNNVTPREFHFFRRDADTFLFDVEELEARRLSDRESAAVVTLLTSFGSPIDGATYDALLRINAIDAALDEPSGAIVESDPSTAGDATSAISSIALFISQSCNLGCVYCYGLGGAYGEKAGLMKHDTAFASVDWLMEHSGDLPSVNISFFGGEPLLNLALMKEVVSHARSRASELSKHVTFGITTNGTLLDDDAIEFLTSEHFSVMVSFDGTETLQNENRPFKDGRASFDIVRKNVDKFLAVSPRIRGRATVVGNADLSEIETTMRSMGFSDTVIVDASPVILDEDNALRSGVGEGTKTSRRSMIERNAERFVAAVKERRIEEGPVNTVLQTILKKEKRFYGCSLGKETVAVSQGGDIYPCHRFVGQRDEIIGNVKDGVISLTDWYYKSNVMEMPDCKSCWARYLCGGGCFYENKAHTGDMLRPDGDYCAGVRATSEIVIDAYCRLDDDDRAFLMNPKAAR